MAHEALLTMNYGLIIPMKGLKGSTQAPRLFSTVQTFRPREGVLVALTVANEDLPEASDHGFYRLALNGKDSQCVARYFRSEELYIAFKNWHEGA